MLLVDNQVNNLEDPICEDAYSAGYRHGYANHTSLQDRVRQQYQECYIRGYTEGLEDYQSNIEREGIEGEHCQNTLRGE